MAEVRSLCHFALLAAAISLGAQTAAPPITGTSTNPVFTADGVVNGATQTLAALAPNTIATLYGTNLAFNTAAAPAGGALPVDLAGVEVWLEGYKCGLFYVSPTQINFLVPYLLSAGTVQLVVVRQSSTSSVPVNIPLTSVSPGIFQWNGNSALAVHLNGQLVSPSAPATAGEVIVMYATGLGHTSPPATSGALATVAAQILNPSALQILFDGVPAPAGVILYAGLAPGFAGLYQINFRVPPGLSSSPQVQLSLNSQTSPAIVQLAVD